MSGFQPEFTPDDWRVLGLLFAIAARISRADGTHDEAEQELETNLLFGGERDSLLEVAVHHRLGSDPELAREVMELEHGDVLRDLAAGGDLARGLAAPRVLDAWVERAGDPAKAAERRCAARGVLLEVAHLAVRMAAVDGQVSEGEVLWLGSMAADLGIEPAEIRLIAEAAVPAYAEALATLDAEVDSDTDGEITGFATIGNNRYTYTATPSGFRYEPVADGRAGEVKPGQVGVVRVMPLQDTSAFVIFAYTTDPDDGFLVNMTFWGGDATDKAAQVGFMLGARVLKME